MRRGECFSIIIKKWLRYFRNVKSASHSLCSSSPISKRKNDIDVMLNFPIIVLLPCKLIHSIFVLILSLVDVELCFFVVEKVRCIWCTRGKHKKLYGLTENGYMVIIYLTYMAIWRHSTFQSIPKAAHTRILLVHWA